tara:strand:- start:552 stop:1157 length:606 start_codon:yes stop_codon:yes gene_type:complete
VKEILFLILFVACAHSPYKPVPDSIDLSSYTILKNNYISCGGHGNISSTGNFSGKLSFSFLSQNDSSFFQFKDALGRKMLLMWITPETVNAWNILENRYYEYDAIRIFFPFLQVVKPNDITKFLWGIEPKYSEQDFTVIKENSGTLSISFENQPIEETLKGLTKAVFKDSANNQKVTIWLSSRTHNETPFDLTKAWDLMHI